MTREQFYQLLQNPSGISYQHIEQLKDILEQFPYFQTARMIYTKGLHHNESFLYSEELKKTAIYAGDRQKLYHLINSRSNAELNFTDSGNYSSPENETTYSIETKFENDTPAIELKNEEDLLNNFSVTEVENIIDETKVDAPHDCVTDENEFQLSVDATKIEEYIEGETKNFSPSASEILEQRLKELGNRQQDEIEKIIIEDATQQNFLQVTDETPYLSFEYKSEEISVSEINVTPAEIIKEEKNIDAESSTSEHHSFTDWLHQLKPLSTAPTSTNVELNKAAVIDADNEPFLEKKTSISSSANTITEFKTQNPELKIFYPLPPAPFAQADLIDRFIQTDPRIEANKTKFYSPVNMAKSSIADAGEIVSETLANIYVQQGNYNKAINAFEKLSLKFPEKSHIFAARIKEMRGKD